MGNIPSTGSGGGGGGSGGKSKRNKSSSTSGRKHTITSEEVAAHAQKVVGALQANIQSGIKKLEEQDHPAAHLLDTMCGPYLGDGGLNGKRGYGGAASFYSEDVSEDDSRTVSEDETTTTDFRDRRRKDGKAKVDERSVDNSSYMSHSDYEPDDKKKDSHKANATSSSNNKSSSRDKQRRGGHSDRTTVSEMEGTTASSYDSDDRGDSYRGKNQKGPVGVVTQIEEINSSGLQKPLASSFAKRCYFTKAGIGKTTQHYEGLTLTGNIVLMLAAAMKLKGCPTICDEDLRRVEHTYPNQFSRLPDELLLSSGWRRISKYCHFSNKPIPDGIPFFHSKQRLHPNGGYYFLLAAAVGMVRPIDVEPLTRDTLVLLETDYPTACDTAPDILIHDPDQWTLVDKFCFFSGGPINTEEDVYYQADFDGNPIYMLAFLSPSLTPAELYKLDSSQVDLKSVAAVEEVESVYDLTERDFDDLKQYHLGPCRALPQYILQPQAWTKVLPPHFLTAKQQALLCAQEYEMSHQHISTAPQQPQQSIQQPPQQHLSVGSAQAARYANMTNNNVMMGNTMNAPVGPPQATQINPDDELITPHVNTFFSENNINNNNNNHSSYSVDSGSLGENDPNHNLHNNVVANNYQDTSRISPYKPNYHAQQPIPPPPPLPIQQRQLKVLTSSMPQPGGVMDRDIQREVEEEGAFIDTTLPMDEALAQHAARSKRSNRAPSSTHMDETFASVRVLSRPLSTTIEEAIAAHTARTQRLEAMQQQQEQQQQEQQLNEAQSQRNDNNPDDEPPSLSKKSGLNDPYNSDKDSDVGPTDDIYYHDDEYDSPSKLQGSFHDDEYGLPPSNNVSYQDDDYQVPTAHHDVADFDVSPKQSLDDDYVMKEEYDYREDHNEESYFVTSHHEEPFSPVSDSGLSSHPGESNFGDVNDHIDDDDANFAGLDGQDDYLYDDHPHHSLPTTPHTDISHQSSAMKGAQELLRRNRQRRIEFAARRAETASRSADSGDNFVVVVQNVSPGTDSESGGTWESGSEMTSVVSGSSVWTDNSANQDRSSRRALILQMAKARMKGNGKSSGLSIGDEVSTPIKEEAYENDDEEKKSDFRGEVNDIDLTGDLD